MIKEWKNNRDYLLKRLILSHIYDLLSGILSRLWADFLRRSDPKRILFEKSEGPGVEWSGVERRGSRAGVAGPGMKPPSPGPTHPPPCLGDMPAPKTTGL
jgi:hypothetical protein